MSTTDTQQRRRRGRKITDPTVVRIELKDQMGHARWVTGDLLDRSKQGIGISLLSPLRVGSSIVVRGRLGEDETEVRIRAAVTWCVEDGGRFRTGLEFLDQSEAPASAPWMDAIEPGEPDCYEILQLSPNADGEMIERVYRMLAQRFHPDNTKTGSAERFIQLTEAFHTLSDPVRRASYDARYRETKHTASDIFDRIRASSGRQAEKEKRQAILELLYAKALRDPENATMSIRALEELSGCPREHLAGALWYLKGKGSIQRADNGRFSITVLGMDRVEENAEPTRPDNQMLLPAPMQD